VAVQLVDVREGEERIGSRQFGELLKLIAAAASS